MRPWFYCNFIVTIQKIFTYIFAINFPYINIWKIKEKELGSQGIRGGEVRDNPQINQTVASFTALGRVGEANDIGPTIAALIESDSRWVNGQRIEISGGMFL